MKLTIRRERPALRIIRNPVPIKPGLLWNAHSHSQFSHKDALSEVKTMVDTVVGFGQPALGLTDHGNMAGSVQLYQACRKAGIAPFPGIELYVVPSREVHIAASVAKGAMSRSMKRHHMCVLAYSTKGYENLVGLSTLSHTNFYNRPLIDHGDLAMLADQGLLEGIAATSGCFFGLIAQAVVGDDDERALSLLSSYAGWFPRFYVELQNHNIDHTDFPGRDDNWLADKMLAHANTLGLPTILTQDAHYCTPSEKNTHETLKRIVAFGSEPDDAVFPGDGFHLADDDWFATHHHPARLGAGAAGLADLLGAHDLVIPELDNYSYNIPFTVADPVRTLSTRTADFLTSTGLAEKKGYLERWTDEMAIVKDTGMAGYLILVAEVTDWCRENRVYYQARGSAAGSLLCWALGITNVDPIKWGLRFERFISRDRTKPPDVDLDIEYDRREELIDWLKTRFSVRQIGTWAKYSLAGEVDDLEGEADARGSLRVAYFSRSKAMGTPIDTWAQVPDQDKADLYELDASTSLKSYGTHAAGLVVSTIDHDFDRVAPLMWIASSAKMVTQFGMNDTEELGQVKLDVLGLKTLAVLHRTMDNMGRDVADGLDWIKLTDSKTFAAIGRGDTDGVFQLEGYAARRGCRDLKPTKISDVIAAMALFRPATMESGATQSYLARKRQHETVPMRHPLITKNTAKTYGVMLFQEQVITILRELGMGPDDLTSFLKAVKASQKADMVKAAVTMAAAREQVKAMAIAAEMSDEDYQWLWHAIEGFAKYGFNQAHSTVYGLTAYWCAYLSVHYSLDFFAGLLAVAAESGSKKEPGYVSAARGNGLRILKPSVNASGVTYEVDPARKGIRRGLVAIKGVGGKAAAEIVAKRPEQGYQSLEEMCRLVYRLSGPVSGIKPYLKSGDLEVGTVSKLHEAGALSCFEEISPV